MSHQGKPISLIKLSTLTMTSTKDIQNLQEIVNTYWLGLSTA